MFKSRLGIFPGSWRLIWLSLGAVLIAMLASPTLTAIGAYNQKPPPVGPSTAQESARVAERPSSASSFAGTPQERSLAPVVSVGLGVFSHADTPTSSVDKPEGFFAGSLRPSGLDPSAPVHLITSITMWSGGNQTTEVPGPGTADRQRGRVFGGAPVTELAPLLNSDNLIRVFNFRNSTKDWLFYDPRPAFAAANTLLDLRNREIYWLKVKRDQNVTLNGKQQEVSCTNEGTAFEDCWNLLVW